MFFFRVEKKSKQYFTLSHWLIDKSPEYIFLQET